MSLQRIEKEFALTGGMDTKQSIELQDEATMRSIVNLRWDATRELRKRPTYGVSITPAAPGTYADATVECLFKRGNEVCALTGGNGVLVVDQDNESAVFAQRNIVVSSAYDGVLKYAPRACKVSRRFIERAQLNAWQEGIYQVSSAVYQGVMVVAWVSISTNYYLNMKAIDLDTGTVIATTKYNSALTGGVLSSVSAVPYYEAGKEGVLIAYTQGSSAPFTIGTYRYNAATRDFVADSNLTTNAKYVRHSMANDASNSSKIYFAFTDNTSGFLVAQYRTIGTVTTTHTANHAMVAGVCFIVGPTNVLIASVSTDVKVEVFGAPANVITLLTASGESIFGVTGSLETDAGNAHGAVVYASCYGTGTPATNRVVSRGVDFSTTTPAAVTGTTMNCPNGWLATSAFTVDGRSYFVASLDQTLGEPTSLIVARCVNDTNGNGRYDPVARICHDRFYDTQLGIFSGPLSTSVVGSKVYFALPADPSATDGTTFLSPVATTIFQATLEFPNQDNSEAMPLPFAETDGTTVVASGLLFEWDGDTPSEHAPVCAPRIVGEDHSAAGSTTVATGISVVARYKWIDARGRLHRSAPSVGYAITTFATKQLDVYVSKPPFRAYKFINAQELEAELYITQDNGSTYYLAKNASGEKIYGSEVDTRSTFWTFSDVRISGPDMPELDAAGVDGGEIAPEPPPSPRCVASIGNRLWLVDAEDTRRIWYTKPIQPGYAPEWSTVCTLTVNDDCLAIEDVAGTPTVFAANGIWQIDGDGPDPLGNGFFGDARREPAEVGCIDRLVCRTSMGVVFRSRKGFYVLGGGLQAIGLPIDPEARKIFTGDYNYARIAHDEAQNEIRIVDAYRERYWVFNTLEQKWSEWTQSRTAQNARDLLVADGRVWYLHQSGSATSIRRERGVDELFTALSTEGWSVSTPKLLTTGVIGFALIVDLAISLLTRDDPENVQALTVTYETWSPRGHTSESIPITGADFADSVVDGVAYLELKFREQRCTAFRVSISETCSSSYEGSSPLAMRVAMRVDERGARQFKKSAYKGVA